MVKIEETIHLELQIDPVIFRREFIRYQKRYLSLYDKNELVHAYIFLQIYVESFLHNYMRHIIKMEFKPPRDTVVKKWLSKEKDKLPIKLDSFVVQFFPSLPLTVQTEVDIIKDRFKRISDIRNMFAHGHKVSISMTTTGKGVLSPAASKLSPWILKQTLLETNELGTAWNNLLIKIQPKLKALRQIKDFKFKLL